MSSYSREKRAAQRFQVLGHAQLRAGHMLVNCVIRDLSQTGAKLGLSSSAKLPVNTDLWLLQGDARMRVVLKWRKGEHAGVAFAKKASSASAERRPNKKVILDA